MIIGLTGYKGSGKDTVGAYLVERFGFIRESFADPLKISAAALFDIDPAHFEADKNDDATLVTYQGGGVYVEMTVREMLQRYGTEAHRGVFGDDFWTRQLIEKLVIIDKGNDVVVTDSRFENETKGLRQIGGIIVRVIRPDVEGGADTHASEIQVPEELVDITIVNDGSIADLHEAIDEMLGNIDALHMESAERLLARGL